MRAPVFPQTFKKYDFEIWRGARVRAPRTLYVYSLWAPIFNQMFHLPQPDDLPFRSEKAESPGAQGHLVYRGPVVEIQQLQF